MKTRIHLLLIVVLSLAICISAQDDATIQTLTGTLAPGAERTFGFPAKKGQSINARISSDDGNVIINEEEGATDLTLEAVEGRNTVTIINRGEAPDRYELVIKVFTPEPEPAEEIVVQEGASSATVDLVMYPYKFERRFSITLGKASGARITVSPADARKRLAFSLENVPEGRKSWKEGDASLIIMADREDEYVFRVSKSDEELLEAKITVELLDETDFSDPR